MCSSCLNMEEEDLGVGMGGERRIRPKRVMPYGIFIEIKTCVPPSKYHPCCYRGEREGEGE